MEISQELENLSRQRAPESLERAKASPAQQELARLIPELEELLTKFLGKPVRRSPAKALSDFGMLPEAHQRQAVSVLKAQSNFVRAAIDSGVSAYDECALVRMAAGKLGLLSDDNVLANVEQTDIVEILDQDQVQVYRSFSCFALCNYSVAELVTYPWFMLYERPSWVQDKLVELGLPIFSDGPGFQSLSTLPAYVVRELMTEEKQSFRIEEKFLARMISSHTGQTFLLSVKRIIPLECNAPANLTFL